MFIVEDAPENVRFVVVYRLNTQVFIVPEPNINVLTPVPEKSNQNDPVLHVSVCQFKSNVPVKDPQVTENTLCVAVTVTVPPPEAASK